jgi:hypothetical protein
VRASSRCLREGNGVSDVLVGTDSVCLARVGRPSSSPYRAGSRGAWLDETVGGIVTPRFAGRTRSVAAAACTGRMQTGGQIREPRVGACSGQQRTRTRGGRGRFCDDEGGEGGKEVRGGPPWRERHPCAPLCCRNCSHDAGRSRPFGFVSRSAESWVFPGSRSSPRSGCPPAASSDGRAARKKACWC